MPIRIDNDLPVKKILEEENIFVMDADRAMSQDIRPLEVVILNLMPLKEDIRQVWNIWKKITGSRLTMINTMCFMTDLLPISCRRLL